MRYKIEFLSDWHVGSGLTAGAETDAEVLKDRRNLPYIPGKTIKGLLRDAVREMQEVNQIDRDIADELFGYEVKDDQNQVVRTHKGSLFFSNANLPKDEQKEIPSELADFLYRNISSTKITNKGVAKANSLRTMEVCMPITLVGEINCYKEGKEKELTQKEKELLQKALKWVRRLGVNRNRGLGRCQFVELEK